jgi:hypothetical protein
MFLPVLYTFVALPAALPCSLCGGIPQQRVTMRQEATRAKVIVVGSLSNARLNADGTGTTDFAVERALKGGPAIAGIRVISIPRYLPVDDKAPKFLLLCDVVQGKPDVVTGRFVKDERIFEYLKSIQELDSKDHNKALQFYFGNLESPVPEIAADAYLEFAKATDAEVGRVTPRLDPAPLRRLLKSETTPSDRLGMFAFLLGGCGSDKDADLLLSLIHRDTEPTRQALGGLLTGYIALRPRQGWQLAADILNDPKRKFLDRFAVISAVRFYQAWKPNESRAEKLRLLAAAVQEGEVADMAIEDLRRWQWWDLTRDIFPKYRLKTHDSPLVQRAILRYALACPDVAAREFVAERRKKEPEAVADAAESLEAEK